MCALELHLESLVPPEERICENEGHLPEVGARARDLLERSTPSSLQRLICSHRDRLPEIAFRSCFLLLSVRNVSGREGMGDCEMLQDFPIPFQLLPRRTNYCLLMTALACICTPG